MLVYGPLIFGSVFYEFNYIMKSIWRSYMIYGMFLILLVSLVLMGMTIASLSIVLTYKQLCHQNYNWWWNSFWMGASGGTYMMLFAVYYWVTNEQIKFDGVDYVYIIVMLMISSCFGFMCGSISILSSYLFVERIYNASSKGEFTKF